MAASADTCACAPSRGHLRSAPPAHLCTPPAADGARALVEAGAPAAAAAIVAAAVAGGEWEATGDANEAAEMCAGAAMDAVCAIGAADGLAHHDALLDAGCAEAAVDMVVAMLGPAATMQGLVRAPATAPVRALL